MTESAVEDPTMLASDPCEGTETQPSLAAAVVKRKKKGVLTRIWRGVFGSRKEDYEKKLQHLSKEEASVLARMKRRAVTLRKLARNVVFLAGIVEVYSVVEHHRGPSPSDGGWIGRIAALLVGEYPSHCYALICGNCFSRNGNLYPGNCAGLARGVDFPHIMYCCPHCNALNTSEPPIELESGTNSGRSSPQASAHGSLARTISNTSSTTGSEISPPAISSAHELPTVAA